MDYRNGRIEHGKVTTGFDGGRIVTIIGKSGSGKSSLAIKMACSIVEPYENGNIFHYDFERATNVSRVKTISGWSDETIEKKYKNLQRNIYSESIYKLVKSIDKLKNKPETYDEIKLDSGEVDSDGNPIYVLPPTVILLDSWALTIPEGISEEDELSGQMSATSIARINNSIIKRLAGPLERGNIILIAINHITQKIEINAFAKTQAAINYLKQDESIPGGSSILYLANNIIRCTTSTKLDEDSTYGVKGFMVKGEFIKSRSNEAGRTFEMVFEQSSGFDNVLSNLVNFKELGLLKGSPRAYYLEKLPEVKFTLKTFKEKYNENEKLRKAVADLIKENYVKFIPNSSLYIDKNLDNNEEVIDEVEEDIELIKCIDKENDVWEGSDGKFYTSEGEEVEYEE
jgi:RecA/RadA recombinase